MPIGAIWRAPESQCRAQLTTLLVECTRQTHCLSSALDKRIACRVHSTNTPLSYRAQSTDAPLSCRVHLTYALLAECIGDRQCAIGEHDRQTASALDTRTVIFWSAIGNRSVLSSSALDKRIVTKSALFCQRSTMAFEHHARRHGRPLRTHAATTGCKHTHPL